jgi:glycosyltransferase involved in cell wall biosynthesis
VSSDGYKLLFLAYACEPGRGSEWGLGWHYVADLSRTQPVWVITHADNQPGLDRYLREKHTGHPVHVTYVKLPRFLGWMRNSYYSLYNLHYYLWQFAAARAARRLHRRVKLDLVQHVSLFRWWMPSAGAALVKDGVGFIFGPVGGGDTLPKGFSKKSPLYSKLSDLLRFSARSIWRHDPFLKRCIRRAHLLLAGLPSSEEWFRRYGGTNIETLCSAIAGAPELAKAARDARANRPKDQPFTFVSCGGLSYYRGVDIAVRAFAKANLPNARYVHLCDGPMRPTIEALARELGVADRVTMMGDLPHIECLQHVARGDACVHTVLRDSQGPLVEAMMAGVPVITLNHLTPAMLVGDDCGVKLPIDDNTTPDELVDALAKVMRDWHDHPEQLAPMSAAAKLRGEEFTPEAKGRQYRAFHQRVLRDLRAREASQVVAPVSGFRSH